MTLVIILNIVLAIAVVGGLLRLLSWAITSSRPDQLIVARAHRHAVPRPHASRAGASRSQRPRELSGPYAG